MDDRERRGLKAMMIGYSILGIIMVIVMFFMLWADHKEKQAMKGITYELSVQHLGKQSTQSIFNLNATYAAQLFFERNDII